MNERNKGFITIAFGRRHAEMAIDMALSLREFHREPVSVAVDRSAARHLRLYRPSPFDQIIILPQRVHPFGARFLLAEATPYQYSVSIDADILFLGPSPFLEYDFTAPLAMYGAYMTPEQDFQTYYPSKQIFADFGLSRYFWGTGGIFVFRKKEASEMFRACYEFYTSGIKKYPRYAQATLSDEMVFGIMGDIYPIDSLPCPTIHPWPMAKDLPTISSSDRQWPVFHMIGPPSDAFMEYLMEKVNGRRREAGFALGSEKTWRDKACYIPTVWDKLRHTTRKFWRKLGVWKFGAW
jgi:hypothetical protein